MPFLFEILISIPTNPTNLLHQAMIAKFAFGTLDMQKNPSKQLQPILIGNEELSEILNSWPLAYPAAQLFQLIILKKILAGFGGLSTIEFTISWCSVEVLIAWWIWKIFTRYHQWFPWHWSLRRQEIHLSRFFSHLPFLFPLGNSETTDIALGSACDFHLLFFFFFFFFFFFSFSFFSFFLFFLQ